MRACLTASTLITASTTLINAKTLGPVLGGYDVVEYQQLEATDDGVLGSSAFHFDLLTEDYSKDASLKMEPTNWTFHFKNQQNRDEFANDPWKYAPRYGGF